MKYRIEKDTIKKLVAKDVYWGPQTQARNKLFRFFRFYANGNYGRTIEKAAATKF